MWRTPKFAASIILLQAGQRRLQAPGIKSSPPSMTKTSRYPSNSVGLDDERFPDPVHASAKRGQAFSC
jgi:hypothetical protein